jgi:hypothetical protein
VAVAAIVAEQLVAVATAGGGGRFLPVAATAGGDQRDEDRGYGKNVLHRLTVPPREGRLRLAAMRTPRALLLALGFAALALAAVQGLTGMQELVFYASPFLLLLGLLLSGRFIGEDAILARRPAPPRPRPASRRWRPVLERELASLLERSTCRLRGPPAALPHAA